MINSFQGVNIFADGCIKKAELVIKKGIITDISPSPECRSGEFNGCLITPGLIDVHVHLREPGFFYKESILTGTKAATKGGFTTVCSMPNLNPVPDCMKNLNAQLDIIRKDAVINVIPYGSITKGEQGKILSDMEAIADLVVAFSDDGKGVQSNQIMQEAMRKAKSLGKIIVSHCEDESLVNSGYIHEGDYAKKFNHRGIPSSSEFLSLKRDLELVRNTGCSYHACHVSTKESVSLIRQAKKEGLDVTCETAPHYLMFCDKDLQDEGRFKMNPPIRGKEDKLALIEGIIDGTIDMIATDHAPHSAEEKSGKLKNSLMGVVGLETAFSVLYTYFVKTKIITLKKLIDLMYTNPAKRFKLGNDLKVGEKANFAVFDLEKKSIINSENFLSKGKSTPFEGMEVFGECILTKVGGKTVWKKDN